MELISQYISKFIYFTQKACRYITMSSISTISTSDSIMTSARSFSGAVASESNPTIMFKKYFPQWKYHMRNSMKIALFFSSSLLKNLTIWNSRFKLISFKTFLQNRNSLGIFSQKMTVVCAASFWSTASSNWMIPSRNDFPAVPAFQFDLLQSYRKSFLIHKFCVRFWSTNVIKWLINHTLLQWIHSSNQLSIAKK